MRKLQIFITAVSYCAKPIYASNQFAAEYSTQNPPQLIFIVMENASHCRAKGNFHRQEQKDCLENECLSFHFSYNFYCTLASSSLPRAFNRLPRSLRTQYRSYWQEKMVLLAQKNINLIQHFLENTGLDFITIENRMDIVKNVWLQQFSHNNNQNRQIVIVILYSISVVKEKDTKNMVSKALEKKL